MKKRLGIIVGALLLSAWAASPTAQHNDQGCDVDPNFCHNAFNVCWWQCGGYILNYECRMNAGGCEAICECDPLMGG